jgi:uncharacterized protein
MLATAFIVLAIALAVGLLAQLAMLLYSSVRRVAFAGVQAKMEVELLAERLNSARRQLKRQEIASSWNGARKFRIDQIVEECEGVKSFYLVPHDKKPLPGFFPGQYLTFELNIPDQRGKIIRCYSLSDRPRADYYRVTIKRVDGPAAQPTPRGGLVSTHFHRALLVGDIVDVKAPSGGFYLDLEKTGPIVLLGGGVGLTPLFSMLAEIVESRCKREVWLFYGVRNREDHIMKERLEKLAAENDNLNLYICYSRPGPTDAKGKDYHFDGRLTVATLKQELPSNNYDYYLCGPGEMMSSLHDGLREWGVPEANIHLEAFGPASVKKAATAPADATTAKAVKVKFARSACEVNCTSDVDSLLDLALASNVPIGYGCRAGGCGTCKTAIISGTVKYLKKPGCEVEAGSCLTCICLPDSELILEA